MTAIAPPQGARAKTLGAYYTDEQIAAFLVRWAIRTGAETVLDPSFGGGVFLGAACRRLVELGGMSRQVFGVELDAATHQSVSALLQETQSVDPGNLLLSNFFEIAPSNGLAVDAVVGNPPFIRYQRFVGEDRKLALGRARAQNVRLSELSSSWAPFLVHSTAMLKPGGRLAMVVPTEIAYTAYSLPLLRHLAASFECVTFLTFRRKLFPDLNEDTLLVLADGKGAAGGGFRLRDLESAAELAGLFDDDSEAIAQLQELNTHAISDGSARLVEYYVSKRARSLYSELKQHPAIRRLGDLADVGIGYVTGANDFFHVSPEEVREWSIPRPYLRPAVRRGRSLSGLRLTQSDWKSGLGGKATGYLLAIEPDAEITGGLKAYLEYGEAKGVPNGYKCRTRTPWHSVPHVYKPDAFLSVMSGDRPRLVANDAGVVAPNSLHILRAHPAAGLTGDAIASLWQTSLSRLSVEIEGHSLGGGMLKLEPTEAERVLVACPSRAIARATDLVEEFDRLVRSGHLREAEERADRELLRDVGLSKSDCSILRDAADGLRERRCSR